MRLLFVNTLYPPHIGGGAEITLHGIVKGMVSRGHEVAVIATSSGAQIEQTNYDGVDVFRVPIQNSYWHFEQKNAPRWQRLLWHVRDSYNAASGRMIAGILDSFQPDLVSCHNLQGISVAAWCAAGAKKIPVLQVLHDYYSVCPKVTMFDRGQNCQRACKTCHLFRLPHAALSNELMAVVGVSRFVLQAHLKAGLFAKVPLQRTIYNARGLAPAGAEGRSPDAFTYGFIGGLTPVKGIQELIAAFAQLCRIRPEPLRLLVAGTGKAEFTEHLKQLAHGLDIEFLGQVNPENFFPKLDVAVVPSVWNEPLGGVVIEALGYGVPVIGSNRGGIPEMVRHEHNGLIYEPVGLVDALARLVADKALFHALRANTVASVETFLNTERMLNEYEVLCAEILTGNGSATRHSARAGLAPLMASRSD